MLAPLAVYHAGASIRNELASEHLVDGGALSPDTFVRHVQETMRRALASDAAGPAAASQAPRSAAFHPPVEDRAQTPVRGSSMTPAASWPARAVLLRSPRSRPAVPAEPPADRVRVSGQVEATEVQVATQVAGRILELKVAEGDRSRLAQLSPGWIRPTRSSVSRAARADRAQADAQLRLLRAGARPEDVASGRGAGGRRPIRRRGRGRGVAAAQTDVDRFERLLASNSGTA